MPMVLERDVHQSHMGGNVSPNYLLMKKKIRGKNWLIIFQPQTKVKSHPEKTKQPNQTEFELWRRNCELCAGWYRSVHMVVHLPFARVLLVPAYDKGLYLVQAQVAFSSYDCPQWAQHTDKPNILRYWIPIPVSWRYLWDKKPCGGPVRLIVRYIWGQVCFDRQMSVYPILPWLLLAHMSIFWFSSCIPIPHHTVIILQYAYWLLK